MHTLKFKMDNTLLQVLTAFLTINFSGCVYVKTCSSSYISGIGACTNSSSLNVSSIYIDSGAAPRQTESICKCDIHPQTGRDTLIINHAFSETGNHTVVINQEQFDRIIVNGEVVIEGRTSIVIKTDGIGGVCVNVTAKAKSLYFDVSCYPSTITTATPPTTQANAGSSQIFGTETSEANSAATITSVASKNTIEGSSSSSVSASFVPPPSTTYKETENAFIGPVAGAVSGGALLVAVVIMIIVLCKRKSNLNKKKSQDNNTSPAISPQNVAEDHYFDMTENPMYDRTDLHKDDIHETKRTKTQYQNIESNNCRIVAEEKNGIYVNNNTNNIFHVAHTKDLPRDINTLVQKETDFPQYAVVQPRKKP